MVEYDAYYKNAGDKFDDQEETVNTRQYIYTYNHNSNCIAIMTSWLFKSIFSIIFNIKKQNWRWTDGVTSVRNMFVRRKIPTILEGK